MAKKFKKRNKGFTLLEMLISITLFSIVTTIAFTALYSIMDANEKAKTIKSVINNLNIAMESMTREIRVGYDYCQNSNGSNCDTGNVHSDEIYFTTQDGCEARYYFVLDEDTIKREIDGGSCPRDSSNLPIVGDDVKITDGKFYIKGVNAADDVQPRVIITLSGETFRPKLDTKFNIQTTVSQRNPDY